MKKNKKIYFGISFALIAILIAIVIGFTYKLSNGFTNNLTSFVVTNDKDRLVINGSKEVIKFNQVNKFKINGLDNIKYEFNIYGHKNFKYKVNEISQDFSCIKQSLNSYFNVETFENEISLTPSYLAEDIIKDLYKENDVSFIEDFKKNGEYFLAKITTENETYSFNLIFDLALDITINEGGIIFE